MPLVWHTEQRKVKDLLPWEGNPRKLSDEQADQLKRSLEKYNLVEIPAIDLDNRLIAGHQRIKILLLLKRGDEKIDVRVPNRKLTKEEFEEYNIRSNKTTGEWDFDLLKDFGEDFLVDIGFSSEELDTIFDIDPTPEQFDLKRELEKLNIHEVKVQKGDVYEINNSRLMCGDSTIGSDMLKLMKGAKADMVMTDPPYILDYLHGKARNGKPTEGFGLKKNRKYLDTDVLPPDFTEKWMANVAKVQKSDFSIVIFEHPKNLRTIWNELEKHWKYRNTIVWHVPNRVQGFSAKYKFFNKHDIALVGSSDNKKLNLEPEEELFQSEYENALFATSGKPHWEGYEKGKKICPTDFIEHIAADEKSSGQGIIFGTKPLDLLIPYIKVLTKRGDLVLEPFGGSGSTLIASLKLGRVCRIMEKSLVYTEVIKNRWEKHMGKKAKLIVKGKEDKTV